MMTANKAKPLAGLSKLVALAALPTLPVIAVALTLGLLIQSETAKADELAVRRALSILTGLPASATLVKAPMPGWWEVRAGNDLLYASDDGKYLFKGEVLSVADKRNLTYERQLEISRIDFKDLPLSAAIVRKMGNGKNKIAIFEDPNCGYCKQIERELSQQKDLTVYTMLVPMLGLDSVIKSRGILCSKNPAQAWEDWMIKGKAPEQASDSCKPPLPSIVKFADAHNISGTPTLFLENGHRLVGAVSPPELKEAINKASQATKNP